MAAEEFMLGEDVTSRAKARIHKNTVVLSIRLSSDELAEIEAAANATGHTVSQVVREAIRNCLHTMRRAEPVIILSVQEGLTISLGDVGSSSRAEYAHDTAEWTVTQESAIT
jgi:uncharacterized protein (DUF1778 family)